GSGRQGRHWHPDKPEVDAYRSPSSQPSSNSLCTRRKSSGDNCFPAALRAWVRRGETACTRNEPSGCCTNTSRSPTLAFSACRTSLGKVTRYRAVIFVTVNIIFPLLFL